MAAGFQYFTSDDSGAPVLTGQVGSMIALLDWVLVSKGGWAKAFTGTNLAAYRSDTGNRFFLRVDDTQAKYARIRAYRSMTTVSAGTNPFPSNAQIATYTSPSNTYGWIKSALASSAPRRYWGVRTNRYIIMFIEFQHLVDAAGPAYRSTVAFGDFPSHVLSDTHNTLLLASGELETYPFSGTLGNTTFTGIESGMGFQTADQKLSVSGNPSGSVVSASALLTVPFRQPSATGATLATGSTASIAANTIATSNSNTGGSYDALPRGKLPNLSVLFGGYTNRSNPNYPTYDLQTLTVGAKTYIAIGEVSYDPSSEAPTFGWLLEITDTDGAL